MGPACSSVIEGVLTSRPIIEQSFVPCANILGLSKKGRSELLEMACARFSERGSVATYTQIKHLMEAIKKSREVTAAPPEDAIFAVEEPEGDDDTGRTRGARYYRRQKGGA